MDIWFEGNMIDSSPQNIPQARSKIAEIIDQSRGTLVSSLQNRISEINGMSGDIENYRVKFK